MEKVVLDLFLGAVPYTPPTTLYIGLSTAAYGDPATGAEVSGGGYGRRAMPNDLVNWPEATGSSPTNKANGTAITFPAATADWGQVFSFYMYDAPVGGNALYGGDLTTPKAILNGDTATFSTGSINVTED